MTHPNPRAAAPGLLLASLMLCACAGTGTAPATTSRAPAAAAASPAAAATAPATPASATAAAGRKARADFPGFVRVMRGKDEVFCQKRNPTGSRARVAEVCYTRDEMRQMEENNKQMWKDAGAGSSSDTLRMGSPK